MLIIHYIKASEEDTRDWVCRHCSGIPFVFVERDSYVMDLPDSFSSMIARNDGKTTGLNYGVPQTDNDNLRHFADNFNIICDQINSMIKLHAIDGKVDNDMWKFMEFLSTKEKKNALSTFIKVLKNVEADFSDMVDADHRLEVSSES
jgi:hypothetical protein